MACAAPATTRFTHSLTHYLRALIHAKRSTLCVSADVTSATAMLSLARAVGPSIVVFKTHADILEGWDPDRKNGTGAQLAAIARRYRFLVFEDRKFADIGFTAQLQYQGGDYRILEWAHIVNAHVLSGPDMIRALELTAAAWKRARKNEWGTSEAGGAVDEGESLQSEKVPCVDIEAPPDDRALLLLAQMSSSGNLLDTKYTATCVSIARHYRDFVMGFIALHPLDSELEDDFLVMTPGCALLPEQSLDKSEFSGRDALGQQYVTPRDLMMRGCNIIIVGIGICNAEDPAAKAEQYRNAAWEAYEECLTQSKS